MNKFLNWLTKDYNTIGIIIIILIVPLYILRFGDAISDKIVKEIAIIGAIFSTLFLFLTFKLNRDNYKRELGKEKVENYFEKINKLKSKWHYRDIFNEDVIPFAISPTDSTSNYFNFLDGNIGFALNLIDQNENFKNYVSRVQIKDSSLLDCAEEEFLVLNQRLKGIYKVLDKSYEVSLDFIPLYEQLLSDKEYMSDAQIKLILKDIDEYLTGYNRLCKSLKNNTFYGKDLFYIAEIKNDNYLNGIRKTFLPIVPNGILPNYEYIQKLLNKF